jgi:DNA repair exonuclease SbcCD ATPase subunit
MTLLKGLGEAGKTSILNAISFVLYGKVRKPFSHGEKSCSVSMISDRYKLNIIRSKVPTKLTVTYKNKHYEDSAGQNIIDEILGINYDEFFASSYFDQRKQGSILSMGPAEQLTFIETFSTSKNGISYEDSKTKIKEHKLILENEVKNALNDLDKISSEYDKKVECLESLEFDKKFDVDKKCNIDKKFDVGNRDKNSGPVDSQNNFDDFNVEAAKKMHSSLITELQNSQRNLRIKRATIDKLTKNQELAKKFEDEKYKLECEMSNLVNNKKKLGVVKSKDEILETTSDVTSMRDEILHLRNFLESEKLQKEFDEKTSQYFSNIRKQISDINFSREANIDEYKNFIENYETVKSKYDDYISEKNKVGKIALDIKKHILKIKNDVAEKLMTGENDITENLEKLMASENIDNTQFPMFFENNENPEKLMTGENVDITTVLSICENLKKFIVEKISMLEGYHEKYNVEINDYNSRPSISECPKCKTKLHVYNSVHDNEKPVLKFFDKKKIQVEVDIADLEIQLRSTNDSLNFLKNTVPTLENFLETLKSTLVFYDDVKNHNIEEPISIGDLQNFITLVGCDVTSQKLKAELENSLKNKILSPWLSKMKVNITNLRKGIPKNITLKSETFDNDEISLKIQEMSSKVKILENEITESWRVNGENIKITREISKLEKSLSEYTKKRFLDKGVKSENNPTDISENIDDVYNDHEKILTEIEKISRGVTLSSKHLEKCINYNSYILLKNEVKIMKSKKSELTKIVDNLNDRIKGTEGLEKACIEAEFYSLENVISNINQHAKFYLSQLFKNPIVAKLKVRRISKQNTVLTKPSVIIHVEYGGEVYDDIDELCGSERQRCDLAFLFAVNDMVGSKIILLDECMNNFDDQMIMSILGNLKIIKGDKQILMISHQAIPGIFDNVIQISKNSEPRYDF